MTLLRKRAGLIFLVVLGLLSLFGAWLLIRSTPFGLGLSWDSFNYLTAARGLLGGTGLGRASPCGVVRPLTGYPPLYPLLLAAVEWLGLNAIRGARGFAALCYALTVFLSGLAIRHRTGSPAAAIFGALLVACSGVLLLVYSWAWTEPAFIVAILAAVLLLSSYFERGRYWTLIASGACLAAALLLRYVGLAFLASLAAALVLQNALRPAEERPREWRRAAVWLVIAVGPLLVWGGRNLVVSGNAINRVVDWHPPGPENFRQLVETVSGWVLPTQVIPSSQPAVLAARLGEWGVPAALLLLAALVLALAASWKSNRRLRRVDLVWLLASSVAIYLIFLTVSLTLFDRATPLDNRILSPIFVCSLLLVVIGLFLLWRREPVAARLASVAVGLALLSLALPQADQAVRFLREDGQGYTSLRWRSSQIMEALRERPPGLVYTNDIPAVYFRAGLEACSIPTRDSAENLQRMRERLQQPGSLLVLFGEVTPEFASLDQLTEGLTPLLSIPADGIVYVRDPSP